jgi:hypothetical protein
MKHACLGLLLATLPFAASAEDRWNYSPEFFVGQYRMIGIDASGPVDIALRLDLAPQGLAVSTCAAPDAGLLVLPGPESEDRFIEGTIEGRVLSCDHFMTWQNYALLACYGEDDARLTLWGADFPDDPLSCSD